MPRKKVLPAAAVTGSTTAGIDSYALPKSIVGRIAKSSLSRDDVKLQKEIPLALVHGSTVFISYLSSLAQDVALERNHKTVTASHVLDAVKQLGWEDGGELIKLLKSELVAYRAITEEKKVAKAKAGPGKWPGAAGAGEDVPVGAGAVGSDGEGGDEEAYGGAEGGEEEEEEVEEEEEEEEEEDPVEDGEEEDEMEGVEQEGAGAEEG